MNSTPEILRCNLSSVVLQMLSIGVKDVSKFEYLQRPPSDAIDGAVRNLTLLGAVGKDGGAITALGRLMGAFPLDPRFSKMIIRAKELGCT